jgi:hypothetical protein
MKTNDTPSDATSFNLLIAEGKSLRDKLDSFRQRAIKSVCEIAETKDASGKYVFSADSSVNKDRWMVCLFEMLGVNRSKSLKFFQTSYSARTISNLTFISYAERTLLFFWKR